MPRLLALALSLVLLVPAVQAAAPPDVEVTTCGQVVPKKALGYLTADLDCTGFTGGPATVGNDVGAAVYLEKHARLDLRGFTITGGKHGVLCSARICPSGKTCGKGPCEVFNGTIDGTAPGGNGLRGDKVTAHDLTVTNATFGVIARERLTLTNATVSNHATAGVSGKKLTLVAATVTGNGSIGVSANYGGPAVRLVDSTVTGNGIDPICSLNPCGDVGGTRLPRLENTTCGTSLQYDEDGGNWGVCAND